MKKKFVVSPKVTRYKVGKLYRVWFRDNTSCALFSDPEKLDNSTLIGFVLKGAIVIYIDEPKWGLFKVVHEDQVGWALGWLESIIDS
jgi:hypothetical protein